MSDHRAISADQACRWRSGSDADLLAECRVEAFRGPGPGGQKRNKTSSAIRIRHLPTGLAALAGELRSQSANRARALRRLRRRLAIEARVTIELAQFRRPPWLEDLLAPAGRLDIGPRDARYCAALGLALDVLAAAGWSVSEAAAALGLSTGHLVRFLASDAAAWAAINRHRAERGLKALR